MSSVRQKRYELISERGPNLKGTDCARIPQSPSAFEVQPDSLR